MSKDKRGRQFPKHDAGGDPVERKFAKGGDAALKGGKGKNAGLNNLGPVPRSGKP